MNEVVDWTELLALRSYQTVGETDVVVDLIETFRSQTPLLVARLRDAAAHADRPSVQREAHTLKGSAGAIGAVGLSRAAAVLEASVRGGEGDLEPIIDRLLQAYAVADECLAAGPPAGH